MVRIVFGLIDADFRIKEVIPIRLSALEVMNEVSKFTSHFIWKASGPVIERFAVSKRLMRKSIKPKM